MQKLSVIIPVFNESESINQLHSELKSVLNKNELNYEIIFVDDGSTDKSPEIITELVTNQSDCKAIFFRRNFGKSRALQAGFRHSSGDLLITMDADLQDDPNDIPNFISKINEGFDLVTGWKINRNDPLEKKIPSRLFNFITSKFSGIPIHDFNCGFKADKKQLIDSSDLYGELHRYIPVLAYSHGFKIAEIPVKNHKRPFGHSKYGMERYLRGFFDSLTTSFLTKYNDRPMYFFGKIGLGLFIPGLIICIYLTIQWFMGYPIGTRPLLTLGILLMILGVQAFSTGLISNMLVDVTFRQTYREHHIKEIQGFSVDEVMNEK